MEEASLEQVHLRASVAVENFIFQVELPSRDCGS